MPFPRFGLDPSAAEFQPDPSYSQVEDLALESGERDEQVSSAPCLEETQQGLQEEELNTHGHDTQGRRSTDGKIKDRPDSEWVGEVLRRSETA